MATHQSGFRKARGTMDPALCLNEEIRKAQVNKRTVATVFFDVEKTYDILWRDRLMTKLHTMGVRGKMFNWIMEVLSGRAIQVKIGS